MRKTYKEREGDLGRETGWRGKWGEMEFYLAVAVRGFILLQINRSGLQRCWPSGTRQTTELASSAALANC